MIHSLLVRNVVIVEQAGLMLGPGLTVITGETGAGKSVLMGSLELIQGGRATADLIRGDAGEAVVTAEMLVDGQTTEIRRSLSRDGRHRVHLDGAASTVAQLRDLIQPLIEIHSQSETQQLADPVKHRIMVDRHLSDSVLLEHTAKSYGQLRSAIHALEEHKDRANSRKERLEWLEFRINRLAPVALPPGEYERLQEKAERLRYSQQIQEAVDVSLEVLSEGETSASDRIGAAQSALQPVAGRVRSLEPLTEQLAAVEGELDNIIRTLQSLRRFDDEDETPDKLLEEAEERLTAIQQYSRDSGIEPDGFQEHLKEMQTERDSLTDFEGASKKLEQAVNDAEKQYQIFAEELSVARRKAALELITRATPFLSKLALPEAVLEFSFTKGVSSGNGFDEITLLFAASNDLPLRPVHKVASGGELSRLLLAIKAAEAGQRTPMTMIFDEIDAGVGGETAHAIAATLRELAQRHQIIAITHLPQVAGAADRHFSVQKAKINGKTVATIQNLDYNARERELARMLGWSDSPESLQLARSMLQQRIDH